ncbi:MAG: hypothetical protein ACTSR8_11815 [Promethearchaeota archaeon]
MPEGLLVLFWDERSGMEIMAEYPEGIGENVTQKTLLHIVNMHAFDEQSGIIGLSTEFVNFASYYCGSELEYYIMIVLNILENPEDYEGKVEEIAQIVIENLENDKYKALLPVLLKKVSR